MKHHSVLAAAGLAVLLAAPIAQAQSKNPKVVSRDELRACMNSESGLADQRKAIEGKARQNAEEAAALRAEQEQLTAEKQRLEESNASMDKFERKIKAFNAKVTAARENGPKVQAELDAYNRTLVAHNEKCGGISFDPDDKAAILKERDASGKK